MNIQDKINNLNSGQKNALDIVKDWWQSSQQCLVLGGRAGTGKSFLIDTLVHTLPNCHPILLCPTNEALEQLRDKVSNDLPLKTVHSALGIAPTVTEKDLSFTHTKIPSFWDDYNLCIVDEASMLPDWILKLLESIKCKIIYAGHESQLPPVVTNRSVYDKCVSPVFEKGYLTYTLKEPMRNKGDLWDFNNILEKSIYKPDTEIPDTYNIKAKDLRDYLKSTSGINDFFEGNTKIVVWTNAAVDAYNIRIRKNLFGENAKDFFLPGDKIILKAPLTVIKSLEAYNGNMLKRFASSKKTFDYLYANSKFTILNAQTIKVNLESSIFIYCYKLQVLGKEGIYEIYVPKDEKGIYHAANFYEHIAWSAKSKLEKDKRYRERHFILSCFANVKHFYCATSHTLQGSGYPNVITINSDINKNANLIERAKLRYVACSRAMNNLMYFKELTL